MEKNKSNIDLLGSVNGQMDLLRVTVLKINFNIDIEYNEKESYNSLNIS